MTDLLANLTARANKRTCGRGYTGLHLRMNAAREVALGHDGSDRLHDRNEVIGWALTFGIAVYDGVNLRPLDDLRADIATAKAERLAEARAAEVERVNAFVADLRADLVTA